MSVWLPRSQQAALVRCYSRQLVEARTTRYISLGPRTHLVSAHSATYALISHRAQSTSSSSSAPASRDATSKIVTNDSSTLEPMASPPTPKDPASDAPLMARVWKKVKHEAAHYWHGSKLLVSEVRISGRLQWKILHGESLTRRERRQASALSLTLLTAKFICNWYLAKAHDPGLASTRTLRRFHHCAIHGAPTSSRSEAIPQHASVDF